MIKRILLGASLGFALLMTGCASPQKMAFNDESEVVEKKTNPVFLMTAKISNQYRHSHQPELIVVHVERTDAAEAKDHINFTIDDKAKKETDDPVLGNYYYLRMELENGKYVLRGLSSMSSSFPIHGFFFTPVHENIVANGKGVFYLGHINATVRERQGDEFKAGPSIPLIDQAFAGASGGTFDIEITDQWDKDEEVFRSRFTALANVEVKKALLPSFDRNRAQKWWQDH